MAHPSRVSDAEISYLAELVRRRSAVVLSPNCRSLVESRLTQILHQEGISSLSKLVDVIRSTPNGGVVPKVVDALMTHETSFFRDQEPFQLMQEVILPELRRRNRARRSIRIWSAACSTGQEAYSVAMVIHQHFRELMGWDLRIVASDLSDAALGRAVSGRFNEIEVSRGVPPDLIERYFTTDGSNWEIVPTIKQMISFRRMNLANPWPAMPEMDVIFMRNVLIYFDTDTRKHIQDELKRLLLPGGFLIVDAVDTAFNFDMAYQRRRFGKISYYQRK